MGKPTGFMEYQRLSEAYAPIEKRLKNYKEFVLRLSDEQAAVQGAPAAQHPGDLLAHRGLFRQYQRFCHIDTPCYL